MDNEWNPESALEGLAAERNVMEIDEAVQAESLFRENLPLAALMLIDLAKNGINEKIRLDASRYIVERIIGQLKDVDLNSTKGDPLLELLGQVVRDVEVYNGGK